MRTRQETRQPLRFKHGTGEDTGQAHAVVKKRFGELRLNMGGQPPVKALTEVISIFNSSGLIYSIYPLMCISCLYSEE